jgi:hypothetical protein
LAPRRIQTRQALSAWTLSDRRWAASGVAAVALFVLGLVFSDFLASPGFPAYDASLKRIDAFFIDNRAEAIGISVCHSLSAAALLIFVAYVHEWLRRGGGTETRLAALALGGGVAASIFLLLSAMLYWTLTRAQVAREPGVAQAVLVLSYLAGGQALALSFAGLIGATSVVTLRTGALPRWIARLGVTTAGLSVLSVAWLIWAPAFNLLLLAAALGFLWLCATSIALIRTTRPDMARRGQADA